MSFEGPETGGSERGAEDLDKKEGVLNAEVIAELDTLTEGVGNIFYLAQHKEVTSSLSDRLIRAINQVAEQTQDRILTIMGGTLGATAVAALHEYAIRTGNSPVEDESVLAYANKAVIAGLVLYEAVSGIRYAASKLKEKQAVEGVDSGTIAGVSRGAEFVINNAGWESGEPHVTSNELGKLYREKHDIFVDEIQASHEEGTHDGWKNAMDRIKVEMSKAVK